MPSNRHSARRRASTTPGRKGKSKQASPSGGDLYQLESLKDYEVRNGVEYFYVKWEGYPDEQNTWEPVTNIVHPTQDLLDQMKELRLVSQASQKSAKVRKSTSKKRKIDSISEKKPRPLKTQKITEPSTISKSSHHSAKSCGTDENAQPTNTMPQADAVMNTAAREDDTDAHTREEKLTHSPLPVDSLLSPKEITHDEEDTSPEEASTTHPLQFNGVVDKEAGTLTESQSVFSPTKSEDSRCTQSNMECIAVESVCKESKALPFDDQENFLPICAESLQFLSHLSVVVRISQGIQSEGSNKVEVKKVKMPLLEVAEKHTKALLAYFLQNVRYYKHSKPAASDENRCHTAGPESIEAGCQANPEMKESYTQTSETTTPTLPDPSLQEVPTSSTPPMTPTERKCLATAPHSAASRESLEDKLVTVG